MNLKIALVIGTLLVLIIGVSCLVVGVNDMYIDIIVEIDDEEIPIELKYKTRNISIRLTILPHADTPMQAE